MRFMCNTCAMCVQLLCHLCTIDVMWVYLVCNLRVNCVHCLLSYVQVLCNVCEFVMYLRLCVTLCDLLQRCL